MLIIRHILIQVALLASIVAAIPPRRTNLCYKNITQPTRCLYLSHPTFLELELPYKAIALPEYVPGLKIGGHEIIRYAQRWLEVKRILPKCWPDLQVALTSILMPQCDEDSTTGLASKIYQPSYDICNDLVNRNNCHFLERHYGWLPMFNCSDSNLYSRNCTNNLRELKSQSAITPTTPDSCRYPLVATNDSKLWFKDVTGCGMHCKHPIMNSQDHYSISSIIAMLGTIGLLSTTSAIVLYVLNDQKASRMAEVTKQCTICQLMVYIGWLLQFVYNQEIACSPNGATLSGRSNICVVTFFLTYAPTLASLFWCGYLAKLCFEKLTGIKKDDSQGCDEIDKNIYMFCYGAPLALSILAALLGEVEGHGLYGLCTVGQHTNILIKVIFLHVPSMIGVAYENFYFLRTIYKLRSVKDKKPRLKRNLTRIMALATLSTIHLLSSIGRHIYEFQNNDRLVESVDKYLACSLNLEKVNDFDYYEYNVMEPDCKMDTKPMTIIYYMELISILTIGTVIASWAFCEANFRLLRRKLVKLLEDNKDLERREKFYQRAYNQSGIVTEFEETCHDAIDMTTPNMKHPEIEICPVDENANLDTNGSLASVSLHYMNDTNNTQTSVRSHNKHRKGAQFKSSRAVINDTRRQPNHQEQQPSMPSLDPHLPDYYMRTIQWLSWQMCQFGGLAPAAPNPVSVPPCDVGSQQAQPLIGGGQIDNRPPWADKSETPQFNFTHGSAQRPSKPDDN